MRRRLRTGALIAASLSMLAQAPPESAVQGAVEHYMAQMEDAIAHGRLAPDWFDVDRVRSELTERLRSGEAPRSIARWLDLETGSAFLSFAPLGARYDPEARYRFPYDESTPRRLSSGVGEGASHSGPDRYSYDFSMPEGTAVLASRAGSVVRVMDGYTEGGHDPELRNRANAVLILHDDGSFAEYAHLSPGVPVVVGQPVDVGDRLGLSGDTGYSSGPHLHFAVRLRDSAVKSRTVPVRFSDGSGRWIRPETGQLLP
jgi:murein DD-endopeptidase MepM/ murein hydrolase activator NlpD